MTSATSIKRKTMTVIMVTSTAALLIMILAFMTYDLLTFRQNMKGTLETQGYIVAKNSTSALAFSIVKDGEEVLSSLEAEPHIIAAALYDGEGKLFLKYPSNAVVALSAPKTAVAGAQFGKNNLSLYQPVIQSGTRLGMLYLESDLRAISVRLKLYALLSLLTMAGSLIVAFWLSNSLQRRISTPITVLAETARNIAEKKDFSARATKTSDDELGYLAGAFNSMLDQIESTHSDLEKSRAHLQIIADHASVYLCQIDRDHRFNFVNRAFAERYHLKSSDILGRHVAEITGQGAYDAIRHHIARALTGERVEYEMEIPYDKLGTRWVHVIYMPERIFNGEVIALVAVINDITARKQAEHQLERARDEAVAASRAKDDFLAALSHELRTPLNPVLLLASEAANDTTLPVEVRQMFEIISKNVSLEARLIDDLLDLTRITRNKLSLDLQPVMVHPLLHNALKTIEADVAAKQIQVSLDLKAEHSIISGDAVRLQQIFWNVLKNAVKFTPQSGKISVATQLANNHLVIIVTDSGIGMTRAETQRVFTAFTQGDHATGQGSHRFGGLGLGLAISQRLAQLHAGKISAASEGRNQGATFTIELPLLAGTPPVETPATFEKPSASAAPQVSLLRTCILLVEDHEPTRVALEQLLLRRNFIVISAGNVAEARAAASREHIDIVVSDIGLPDGNGYNLMAELRVLYGLKGIALTGYGMEEDMTRSADAGFMTHLVKPVHVASLENALAALGVLPQKS